MLQKTVQNQNELLKTVLGQREVTQIPSRGVKGWLEDYRDLNEKEAFALFE